MAYEVKPWKKEGLTLSLKTDRLTERETFSREINEKYGEGGGLNANYRTVEAIAIAVDFLSTRGLRYGMHYIFKTAGVDEITFDFFNSQTKTIAEYVFKHITA